MTTRPDHLPVPDSRSETDSPFQEALKAAQATRYTEAELHLAEELVAKPGNPAAWYLWSVVTGSPELRAVFLRQALHLMPSHALARSQLPEAIAAADSNLIRQFDTVERHQSGVDMAALQIARDTAEKGTPPDRLHIPGHSPETDSAYVAADWFTAEPEIEPSTPDPDTKPEQPESKIVNPEYGKQPARLAQESPGQATPERVPSQALPAAPTPTAVQSDEQQRSTGRQKKQERPAKAPVPGRIGRYDEQLTHAGTSAAVVAAASTLTQESATSPPWAIGMRWLDLAGEQDNRATVALLYLAGLTVAEMLTVFVEPRVGVVTHVALMLLMMVHTVRRWEYPDHFLWLSLTMMPLIRIISMSLPLVDFSLFYWFLVTSVPLFAAAIMAMRIMALSLEDVGLTWRGWPLQLLIGLVGIPLGVVEYYILRPDPLISELSLAQLWWPALIILISTGLLEELIFRGIAQPAAVTQLGVRFGIIYIAAYFAVLHIGYKSLTDLVFVFVVGLAFGWIVYRTKNIVGVTIAHGLVNIVLFLVMPFLAANFPQYDPMIWLGLLQ